MARIKDIQLNIRVDEEFLKLFEGERIRLKQSQIDFLETLLEFYINTRSSEDFYKLLAKGGQK